MTSQSDRRPSGPHVAGSNLVARPSPSSPDGASERDPTAAERRASIAAGALRLRAALARTIRPGATLTATAAALSTAYRSGNDTVDPGGHVHDAASAAAYAAARMPATYAASSRAMAAAADRLPGFRPTSLLDIGAGTGSAAWAAAAVWPSLAEMTLVDREPSAIALGRRLAATAHEPDALRVASWITAGLAQAQDRRADLVVATYVLGELPAASMDVTVARLWASTARVLLLVEPGSRDGFERIRAARASLIAAGGHVAAPCPGDEPCPIEGAAWCHFLARLDRSPLQRDAKAAARSWEDEPFSYVAVGRSPDEAVGSSPVGPSPVEPAARVVLGRPRHRPGMIELRICDDGRIERRILSRRDGPAWKTARDLEWGDPVPREVLDAGR